LILLRLPDRRQWRLHYFIRSPQGNGWRLQCNIILLCSSCAVRCSSWPTSATETSENLLIVVRYPAKTTTRTATAFSTPSTGHDYCYKCSIIQRLCAYCVISIDVSRPRWRACFSIPKYEYYIIVIIIFRSIPEFQTGLNL